MQRLRRIMRRAFSLVRPRLVDAVVLSLPMPTSLWKGENPAAGTKFELKLVADADDPDLAKHEPRWRLRQCRKDFARGAWCILAIDTEIDEPIGILWAATETRGLNPLGGPVRSSGRRRDLRVRPVGRPSRTAARVWALALAAEYTAQQAIRAPDVNWLHVMVEAENEASIALLIDGWHMWDLPAGQAAEARRIISACWSRVRPPALRSLLTEGPTLGSRARGARETRRAGRTPPARCSNRPTPIAEIVESLKRGPDWEGID